MDMIGPKPIETVGNCQKSGISQGWGYDERPLPSTSWRKCSSCSSAVSYTHLDVYKRQLYDVGFNHFFRAPSETFGGDLVYFQGHSSPGVYARAFLEGRITEEQLEHFRQEVDGKGLSSYPLSLIHI